MRTLVMTALLCACAGIAEPAPGGPPANLTARPNPDATPAIYRNGLWYVADENGVRFEAGDRYQAGGVFVATAPDGADIVDLSGAYIVPGFGEAHNHNLDGPWTAGRGQAYLRDGVFYMKNTNSVNSVDAWAAEAWETPGTVDIAWAHAGISVDEGHPEALYRRIANVYRLDPEELEGDVFWDAPDIATLEEKWPAILATEPDWIKLYLLHTEDEGERPLAGLSRAVFARAVELAHEAGLKATVHVNTARDFAAAMAAGADEAAHMPPQSVQGEEDRQRYLLTPEMARAAARSGFVTVPTTALIEAYETRNDPERERILEATREVQRENLRLLKEAGAPIAFGSDRYDGTGLTEALAVRRRGVFTDEEILRIAVETPSRSIFPDRAIGTLSPGYEASFVALECDPRDDFAACVAAPLRRIKQGIEVGATGAAEAD